ncbi:hypothetical protein [Flaviaesturariibacter amylovorans]|uniref:Uncharacterized protein n=1 Tax=Flaviaesturariibacter amylovorans TaxID=1084520 RepID=A0ABP8HP20_9BACT
MHYIDLNSITEEHVCGHWEVFSRALGGTAASVFSDIRIIEIRPGHYRSVNGKERTGEWQVVREDRIIYNPQLKFFIDGQQVGNAIITRLLSERSAGGCVHKLTLYFSTGLELLLHKKDNS